MRFQAKQTLVVRGVFPMLADARHLAESVNATIESVLNITLDHDKTSVLINPHNQIVLCQNIGDLAVVKIIELED